MYFTNRSVSYICRPIGLVMCQSAFRSGSVDSDPSSERSRLAAGYSQFMEAPYGATAVDSRFDKFKGLTDRRCRNKCFPILYDVFSKRPSIVSQYCAQAKQPVKTTFLLPSLQVSTTMMRSPLH